MKTNIIRVSILLLIAVTSSYLFNGCEASIGTPSGTGSLGNLLPAGETQLRYVAIGNSLTAGYMNGAMYKSGQQMSWTAQMAKQMNVPFVGPYFSDPGVVPDARLFFKGIDAATGLPIISRVSGPILVPAENVSHPSPYNNLGVPGALSFDMLDTSTFAVRFQRGNPLFSLIMRDQAQFGKSIVEQAIRQNPNLITLWIGNNDVLLYAASGGTDSINFPGIPGQGPTPIPVFQNAYNGTVNTLLTSLPKTKIVVANIPDVLATPLATTVPRAAVALTRQGQVDSLRAGYLQVNAAIKAAGRTDTFSFNLGANRIIVADPSVPLIRRRYIRDNEYVLLTAQDSLRVGQGS
ncbi:MAG: hypothetical protein JNL32_11490, partial [Candidatus Kapabacteria bacterium]|nr:hypothetical protein [Candidatus Kapabacteria bacterium]